MKFSAIGTIIIIRAPLKVRNVAISRVKGICNEKKQEIINNNNDDNDNKKAFILNEHFV